MQHINRFFSTRMSEKTRTVAALRLTPNASLKTLFFAPTPKKLALTPYNLSKKQQVQFFQELTDLEHMGIDVCEEHG
jgi:hypothetical protein